MHSAEDIHFHPLFPRPITHVNERIIIYTVTRCRDALDLTLKGF